MAGSARAGELRTKITIVERLPGPDGADPLVDADGYPTGERENPLGDGQTRYCKWVNAYGREVYEAKQAGVEEPATLTMRYTDKLTPTCVIYRDGDPRLYEVISVNDVENRHVWLEVKVSRKVAAK